MKTKLFTALALIILSVSGFVFNNLIVPSTPEVNTPLLPQQTQSDNRWLDKFYIGAIDADCDNVNNYDSLKYLGFNLWHTYMSQENSTNPNRWYPQMNWAWRYLEDKLMNPFTSYEDTVNKYINAIYNDGERELLMMRPKIEWLCHGQRSDYKCSDYLDDPELWFYHFQPQGHTTGKDTTDYSQFGNNTKVRYCQYNTDGAGLVVSRLKANTEQSHRMNSAEGNKWFGDSECDWLIKPSIRIDSSFANNLSNMSKKVCRIDIKNQGDTLIKSFDIRVRNFKKNQDSTYKGNYLEEFYFLAYNDSSSQNYHGAWGDKWLYSARGEHDSSYEQNNLYVNRSDIQVYWYGNCDMWIDYVRVDNDVADGLLNPNSSNYILFNQWIQEEVTQIGNGKIMKYYLELVEFNNIPCMAYVNSRLKFYSNDRADLMQDLHNWLFVHVPLEKAYTVSNAAFLNNQYIQKVGFTQVFAECYPLNACYESDQTLSKIPETLPSTNGGKILAEPISPSQYDYWLQDNMNHKPYYYRPGTGDVQCTNYGIAQELGHFRYKMQLCDSISKLANIPFIYMAQAHQWYCPWEVRREPTNEELQMMANVAVSYGVKGMLYYSYSSLEGADYGTGLIKPVTSNIVQLRYLNYYEQINPNKIETIQSITNRLKNKWGQYLVNFNNADRHSYIYNDNNERDNLLSNTYFKEIRACIQNPNIYCVDLQQNTNYENSNSTYIQAATFKKENEQNTNYFMLVNRRCSPGDDDCSGRRFITVIFDSTNVNEFSGFNNWKIVDLYNDSTVFTFDKRIINNIILGKYKPGEGKLYKIVPVMQEGGTFVCDEYVSSSAGSFECKGNITNNGYELEIEKGVTINFKDNVGINFSHSRFKCGMSGSNTNNVFLKGKGNEQWKGLKLSDCDAVQISHTTFQDIKYIDQPNEQNSAICINDCVNFTISNSMFYLTTQSSGIYALYSEEIEVIENIIGYNSFEVNCSYSPTPISLYATGSIEIPILLQSNTLENKQSTGGVGISISNITGGAIKSNVINNFSTGINSLSSTLDISGNIISSDLNNSIGIFETAESCLNLGFMNYLNIGGDNIFSNTGTTVNNIYTTLSDFNINEGYNTFNVYGSSDNCHLRGSNTGTEEIKATENCFQINTTNTDAIDSISCGGTAGLVNYIFEPYSCEIQSKENFIVLNMRFDFKDTIYKKSTGGSGGNSNPEELQTSNYKTLKDSININLRKRNYAELKDQCKRMLLNYPDSSASIGTVAKLYLSSLTLDTLGDKIGPLKTFFETLIINNQGKTALINRAFYFIQKCKVSLKQYTSALQGFELIITQNPYTYEGLIASWDYASTQLLDSLNGGSGGFKSKDINEDKTKLTKQMTDCFGYENENDINKDTIKFTKTDRKIIIQNTERAFDDIKTNETKKYDDVKKRSERGDEKARVEYQKMKTLNETNKIKQPRTIIELNSIIQKDFQKVFVKTEKPKKQENTIPTKFELYQNYPNPFNPTTKIAYDLPKDAKVKLIIYDILGREIKTIVNNEFKPAGKYINEFNGSQFASGVYFARLLVNEGKDFIAVKKLVLIK